MKKINLSIIFGGKSSEYLISLHSAASIIKNIPTEKFDVTLIGITEEGKWMYFPGNVEEIDNDTWHKNPGCCEMILSPSATLKGFVKLNSDGTFETVTTDCLFPVLHGKNGEDGTIQGLCELSGVPYVGCGVLSSSVCMDKEFTHIVCEAAGVKTAPFMSAQNDEFLDLKLIYEEAASKLKLPFFIKPANAGSSYGISKIGSYDEFEKGMKLAFNYDRKVVLETTIEGFEIGCAVLGNSALKIGEVDEIEMYFDFFNYDEKYHSTTSKIHCPARSHKMTEEQKEQAKIVAINTYKALNCSGMARVDMFLTPQGEILLNEVNTIPGLTSVSRYPSMLRVGLNMNYSQLLEELVELAMTK